MKCSPVRASAGDTLLVNHSRVTLVNKTAAPLKVAGTSADDEPMIPITSSNFDIDSKDEYKMSDTERYMNANYINVINTFNKYQT